MNKADITRRDELVKEWIYEAADHIRNSFQKELKIKEKTNRKDLVTNMDQETESFLIEKITSHYPNEKIIAEESKYNQTDLNGIVWIIDPIDGTLNFVKQRNDFAIMIAVYEDGVGKIGYIYDVRNDKLYVGIKGKGARCNNRVMEKVDDIPLKDGLVAISGLLLIKGGSRIKRIAEESSGVRVIGSAGIETLYTATGRLAAYVAASLAPWDIAAGKVISEELGLIYTRQDGNPVDLTKKNPVLVATPKTYKEIYHYLNEPE